MEVIYEGPKGLFHEFTIAVCDVAGVQEYTQDGLLTKRWVVDELVRIAIQFDPEEARNEVEILRYLRSWAAGKSPSIRVETPEAVSDESKTSDNTSAERSEDYWDVPLEAMHILTDEEVADLTDEERGIVPKIQ